MQTGLTLADVSERLAVLAGGLDADYAAPVDAPPPDEARRHLRWLRNLQGAEYNTAAWLDRGGEEEQAAKLQTMLRLIAIYAEQLRLARGKHPAVLQHPGIIDANEAVQAMSLAALEHALDVLPDGHPDIPRLEALLDKSPQKAELRLTQAVQHLLMMIESGIERVSGKAVCELSATDKLVAISTRIRATARQLRSIDTLEPPVREEAVELAREILRRLKASFDTKPFTETMSVGTPDDRAQLAEKIGEMVDVYKNLLSEAAQITPGILHDPRILEANDAVSGAAHAVSLLAAREMPSSMAAAQQISAAEQAGQKWKQIDNHAIARLLKSMQGGMEKAADVVQGVDQEQQKNAELTQSGTEQNRRKKRGSRRAKRSSVNKAATRRSAGDLDGDGVLDVYQHQGLNIKADDLALAKQLGASLRGIGQQVSDLPPLEVKPPIEKKSQSGKPFSTRQKDERDPQQNKHNPRGQGGPGAG